MFDKLTALITSLSSSVPPWGQSLRLLTTPTYRELNQCAHSLPSGRSLIPHEPWVTGADNSFLHSLILSLQYDLTGNKLLKVAVCRFMKRIAVRYQSQAWTEVHTDCITKIDWPATTIYINKIWYLLIQLAWRTKKHLTTPFFHTDNYHILEKLIADLYDLLADLWLWPTWIISNYKSHSMWHSAGNHVLAWNPG